VGVQRNGEFDVFSDQAPDHLLYATDGLIKIQDRLLNDLLPAKHQELTDKGSRAVRCLLDLLDLPAIKVSSGAFQQQVAVASNHCEQIVEVVRYSPSEATDSLHFLGLQQNLLGSSGGILRGPLFDAQERQYAGPS
jgi:hypothetical protein